MMGMNCSQYHVTITAFDNVDSVIDKYQIRVFSITCDLPTDAAVSDSLNVDRVRRRSVVTSFFLVAAVACSWQLFGFSV